MPRGSSTPLRYARNDPLPIFWRREPSVFPMRSLTAIERSLPQLEHRKDGVRDFLHRHCFHAAEIDRALAQGTGTALDLVTKDLMPGAERAGEPWFGRTKDRDDRDADDRREMHCAGVVRQEQRALAQFGNELVERGFSDPVRAVHNCGFDCSADFRITRRAKENPLHRLLV